MKKGVFNVLIRIVPTNKSTCKSESCFDLSRFYFDQVVTRSNKFLGFAVDL